MDVVVMPGTALSHCGAGSCLVTSLLDPLGSSWPLLLLGTVKTKGNTCV